MLERFLNRALGNFAEGHALEAFRITTNDFAQMPRDGFSLAVTVGRQINGVGVFGVLLQFFENFFFARQHFITRFPTMIGINAHAPNQSQLRTRRFGGDLLRLAQIFCRGFGLGGSLGLGGFGFVVFLFACARG